MEIFQILQWSDIVAFSYCNRSDEIQKGTDYLCAVSGCSQKWNCRKSHQKSTSCLTSSPPAYLNKPLDFAMPNLDPESFMIGSWINEKKIKICNQVVSKTYF